MGKRRDFSIFVFVFITLIPVALTAYQLIQLIEANQTFNIYKQAPLCSERPTCREVIDTTIVGTKSIGASFTFYDLAKKPYTKTTNEYEVVVAVDENKTKTTNFFLYTIPDLNKFDVIEFGIPKLQSLSFAEIYLPVGDKVKIEMWNGNITIIFMNYFTEEPEATIPNPNGQPMLVAPPAKNFFEVAIATVDYPAFILLEAQSNFLGSILILFCAEFSIFAARKFFR